MIFLISPGEIHNTLPILYFKTFAGSWGFIHLIHMNRDNHWVICIFCGKMWLYSEVKLYALNATWHVEGGFGASTKDLRATLTSRARVKNGCVNVAIAFGCQFLNKWPPSIVFLSEFLSLPSELKPAVDVWMNEWLREYLSSWSVAFYTHIPNNVFSDLWWTMLAKRPSV